MKKMFIFAAVAVMALSACTKDEMVETNAMSAFDQLKANPNLVLLEKDATNSKSEYVLNKYELNGQEFFIMEKNEKASDGSLLASKSLDFNLRYFTYPDGTIGCTSGGSNCAVWGPYLVLRPAVK